MNWLYRRMEIWRPYILSILRMIVGLLLLQHGLSKVFDFPAPSPVGALSGVLILAAILRDDRCRLVPPGRLRRIVAFVLSGEMAFAYFMGHAPRSFYPIVNAGEVAILFCFIFLYFAFRRRRSAERRPRGTEPGLAGGLVCQRSRVVFDGRWRAKLSRLVTGRHKFRQAIQFRIGRVNCCLCAMQAG